MARILWLSWCGGGNLPPSLGIAKALEVRGHTVTFVGRREMVPRAHAAGFAAVELTESYAQLESYPADNPVRGMICYLTSPAVVSQAADTVRHLNPDITIVDAKFVAALSATSDLSCPSVVVCHTLFYRMLDTWREHLKTLSDLRKDAGFSSLPCLDDLWFTRQGVIVTTLASLDAPREWSDHAGYSSQVHHVGPVLDWNAPQCSPVLTCTSAAGRPVVLLSFSTQPEQRYLANFQNTLDALEDMPVHVVATTAGAIRLEEVRRTSNSMIVEYADHDSLMEHASLVVTHGGHGTVMRAIKHGVPLILLPGIAPDQETVAAACQEWGVGRVVPQDADVETMRRLIENVLWQPGYRARAEELREQVTAAKGASSAALKIEVNLDVKSHPSPLELFR
jgi:MGT family glycosyltransferase